MNVSVLRLLGLAVVLSVVVAGCSGAGRGTESVVEDIELSGTEITVGSKEFAEQKILGQITIQVLQAAGATVNDQTALGGTKDVRQALTARAIDMYWEYTATGWLIHLDHKKPVSDPQKQFEAVAKEDLKKNNIKWLAPPAPANNTFAIATRSEVYNKGSEAYDEDLARVKQISDFKQLLQEHPEKATLCAAPEFLNRKDGLSGMEKAYNIEFPDDNVIKLAKPYLLYHAIDEGQACNFGEVFKTNGRIPTLDLTLVEDDKASFGYYNPTLTMNRKLYKEHPEIKKAFAPVSRELTTKTLRNLNRQVTVEGRPAAEVARNFLQESGLLTSEQLSK